jgi:hypothetical protein
MTKKGIFIATDSQIGKRIFEFRDLCRIKDGNNYYFGKHKFL